MALADTAKLIAELTLKDKMSAGLKTAAGNLNKFESGVGRVGKGVGQVSAGLSRAGLFVGGAAITGIAGAAKATIEWQEAFQGVVKTVDEATFDPGQTFRDVELALRNLSTEMPNTAIELAAIAEAGGQMGIAGRDIESFTRQVAILASTTNVGAEDAAMALGQLQNVIGLTGEEFDNFAASLVDLGNKGNSTESAILEVARRAGGAARLFGVAKDETLGWAAAAANLGLNEELAGTALQNLFIKSMPKFIDGSKELQKVMGMTGKQVKQAFKKDAGGAMESLIAGFAEIEDKGKRLEAVQDIFGKGSGLTRLVLGLADSYEQNLAPSLDDAAKSWEDATAAQEEFDKRNATVRSAISRLRNGVMDAAITVGEGFTPALGEAADELGAFLKQDANRAALKALGEDIGDAIRGVNWKEVLDGARDFMGVMKVAFDWAKRLFDVFNALPTEIKGATAGFLALNKLSGGLIGGGIGNIVGGLTTGLAGKIPGVGKAFAQPVFVTNWPVGGVGGGGGAAGAAGGGSKVGKVVGGAVAAVTIVGSALAVLEQQKNESAQNTAASQAIRDRLQAVLDKSPSADQLRTQLAAVETGIAQIRSNPLHTLVQGEALTNLQQMQASLKDQIVKVEGLRSQTDAGQAEIKDTTKTGLNEAKSAMDRAKERITAAQAETRRETTRGANQTSAATARVAPPIVGAIRANRPIVTTNVKVYVSGNSVTRTVAQTDRTSARPSQGSGPTSGSGV